MMIAARPLEQCGLGFPLGAAPENVETEAVDQRVPEHVQRIGNERRGARQQAGRGLDDKHCRVDDQDRNENSLVPITQRPDLSRLGLTTLVHGE